MLVTLTPPARLLDFSSILRIRLMGSCSERAPSLPSTFQEKTWSRHRRAASIPKATSSGFMYLKTPQGYPTRTDLSQPETRTKTKTSRLTRIELELCCASSTISASPNLKRKETSYGNYEEH